mmetsp:Transcript_26887/g.63067  ORF Transcript_26887/g.63067 Transcript_26887/m.63067 type:complete len:555 (+) Transcript_26887:140-1804(+)|eukprot:s305_g16.t1
MEAASLPELVRVIARQHADILRLAEAHRSELEGSLAAFSQRSSSDAISGDPGLTRMTALGKIKTVEQPLVSESLDPVPAVMPAETFSVEEVPSPRRDPEHEEPQMYPSPLPTKRPSLCSSGDTERETTTSHYTGPMKSFDKVKAVDFHLQEAINKTLTWERVRRILDFVAGALVIFSCLLLLLELEVEGEIIGANAGYLVDVDPVQLKGWLPIFETADVAFMIIFLLELLTRVLAEWPSWHRDYANLFDAVLVVVGFIDLLVMTPANSGAPNATALRIVRTLKCVRAVRLMRTFRFVKGLRLLVQACQCFLPSLCWSMVLLAVFMSMGALVMGNLLLIFVENQEANPDDRLWIWTRYGTAYRALYTLYEVTFAGNWPTNARPVMEKVSHAYVFFFLLYVTLVVFAVIRVITATFLKDTLDAAQNDAEQLVVDRMNKKAKYVEQLEAVFKAIDQRRDGTVSEERLNELLSHPQVAAYFNVLDLDVQETSVFFHIIDNGDGEVTLDEFIDGILRCKGNARAVDSMAIRADLKKLTTKVNKIQRTLKQRSSESEAVF